MITPEQYLDYIDKQYEQGRVKGLSRLDILWSKWSREMNVEIRRRIDSKEDPEELRLKYVYLYWLNRSQLLEVHFMHPNKWSKNGTKKRLARTGKHIRKMVCSPNGELDDLSPDELQQRLLSGVLGGKFK